MGIVVNGTKCTRKGEEFLTGATGHNDAVGAALGEGKRSTAGSKSSSYRPTIGVKLFFDFKDADWWILSDSSEVATAGAIRDAVAAGVDDEVLAAVAKTPAKTHVKDRSDWVQATVMKNLCIDGNGDRWEAGSVLVRPTDGKAYIDSPNDFAARHRTPTSSETKLRVEAEEAAAAEKEVAAASPDSEEPEPKSPTADPKPASTGSAHEQLLPPAADEGGAT